MASVKGTAKSDTKQICVPLHKVKKKLVSLEKTMAAKTVTIITLKKALTDAKEAIECLTQANQEMKDSLAGVTESKADNDKYLIKLCKDNVDLRETIKQYELRVSGLKDYSHQLSDVLWDTHSRYQDLLQDIIQKAKDGTSRKNIIHTIKDTTKNIVSDTHESIIESEKQDFTGIAKAFNDEKHRLKMKQHFASKTYKNNSAKNNK